MFLVFDTETTGLPIRYDARISDVDNWPRVIQLAWAFYGSNRKLIESRVDLIKPDGWVIPTERFWIENGFSQSQSESDGIPIKDALSGFLDKVEQTQYLVAHNMSYDHPVLGAECVRAKIQSRHKPERICTKDISTDFCKMPGKYGYKWPTLSELHLKLFDVDFEGAHDALLDVKACAKCLFELERKKVVQLGRERYSQASD